MPELPEVETLCRQLNKILPGEEILAVEVARSPPGESASAGGETDRVRVAARENTSGSKWKTA